MPTTTPRVDVNVSNGLTIAIPLTPAEQAAYDAALADVPVRLAADAAAAKAAAAHVSDLRTKVTAGVAALRATAVGSPATAQVVADLTANILELAQLASGLFAGT